MENKNLKVKPKILFIRTGALGDVIMTTSLVRRCFSERNGDCEIYFQTHHEAVFKDNPYVYKTLPTNFSDYSKFDIIYNLDWAYEKNNNHHVIDVYEKYVFGYISENRYAELWESPSDIDYTKNLTSSIGKFMVIHMRSINNNDPSQAAKNIDERVWKNIIISILNTTDIHILQIGSEHDLCFGGNPRLIDLRGKLSIHQIKSLANNATCYLGSDSGPTHAAATSNTKILALYTISKIHNFHPIRKEGEYHAIPAQVECQGCLINVNAGAPLNCPNNIICRYSFNPENIVSLLAINKN